MDPAIIGALIGAVAIIVAPLIPLLTKRKYRYPGAIEGKREETKLDIILFVATGEGWLGPIQMRLYSHRKPDTMISHNMDDPLELPEDMRAAGKRRLFWKEGNCFLKNTVSYGKQGVRTGHTLMLTDKLDSGIASVLVETVSNMPKSR